MNADAWLVSLNEVQAVHASLDAGIVSALVVLFG